MTRHLVLLSVLLLLMGCGQNERGVHQAGKRVGETLTDFAKGVGSGVDTRLEVPVELTEKVTNLGLKTTVAKSGGIDKEGHRTIMVYFISTKEVKAWLLTKALNDEGQEIGRTTVEVDLAADDAKYVTFAFDRELDSQRVDKYVVDIGKPVPPKPQKPAQDAPGDKPDGEA